jgi:tetratricopeptide (TPR) repeat protein
MFSTFPKPLRILAGLLAGFALAVAAQAAGAQTLADVQGLMKKGDMPQALREVDRYIASQPRDAQGPFTKGLILSEMGRSQDAITVFTGLTENFPELPEPYNNLAVLYAQERQYDKAREALEMAIRTHPSYSIAHENLGDVYAKLASQAYGKALQIDSSNKATQTKLSMIRELISVSGQHNVQQVAAAKAGKSAPVKVAAAEPVPAPVAAPAVKPEAASPPAGVPAAPPSPPTAAADKPAVEAPPAAAKPGAKDAPAAAVDEAKSEIAGIIRDWAGAWSRKDVKAYLSFYAGDFQTPKGMTRRQWEAERRQRIDRPGRLRITVDDVRVSVSGATATARFRQRYASATFNSTAGKILVFVKSGDRWLIRQERVA